MSRSIGDFIAHSVGGTSEPGNNLNNFKEIFEYEITLNSRYLVIASDGVWEFLSNEQVMELVNPYFARNDINGASNKLIEESVKCWKSV